MKIVAPILLAAAALFVAGCGQDSNSSESPNTNSAVSQAETNTVNTMNEVSKNVVNTATNAYMSTTNAMLTNSAATNNP